MAPDDGMGTAASSSSGSPGLLHHSDSNDSNSNNGGNNNGSSDCSNKNDEQQQGEGDRRRDTPPVMKMAAVSHQQRNNIYDNNSSSSSNRSNGSNRSFYNNGGSSMGRTIQTSSLSSPPPPPVEDSITSFLTPTTPPTGVVVFRHHSAGGTALFDDHHDHDHHQQQQQSGRQRQTADEASNTSVRDMESVEDGDIETAAGSVRATLLWFGRQLASAVHDGHISKLIHMRASSSGYLRNQALTLLMSFLFFYVGAYFNSVCQVIAQTVAEERFTHSETLPDIGFSLIPQIDWLSTEVAVGLPMVLMYGRIGVMFLRGIMRKWSPEHSNSDSGNDGGSNSNCGDRNGTTRMIAIPMIIAKRILFIHGAIFILRGLTVAITILPNPHAGCVATIDRSASVFWNAFLITVGQAYTCNDVFFSGHAAAIMLSVLFWLTYAPERRFVFFVALPLAVSGWLTLLATRFHYSLDVFFGIMLAFLAWMVYHVALQVHFNHAISTALSVSSRSPWSLWRMLIILDIIEGEHSSHHVMARDQYDHRVIMARDQNGGGDLMVPILDDDMDY